MQYIRPRCQMEIAHTAPRAPPPIGRPVSRLAPAFAGIKDPRIEAWRVWEQRRRIVHWPSSRNSRLAASAVSSGFMGVVLGHYGNFIVTCLQRPSQTAIGG